MSCHPFVRAVMIGSIGIGLCSCTNDAVETPTTYAAKLVLEDLDGQVRSDFAPGETVVFALKITNLTDEPTHIPFTSSCHDDIAVSGWTGDDVWRKCGGACICTAVLVPLRFQPYETVTLRTEWDQRDLAGTQVRPGTYRTRGFLLTSEPGTRADYERLEIAAH